MSLPIAPEGAGDRLNDPNGLSVSSIHAARGFEENNIQLELEDGTIYRGYSFGAQKSVSGEMVFQTGMVGYPESITDPSYRGQILVMTFPLIGNYGVPSRDKVDELLENMPAYFESSEIHIAGLVVASYSENDFSHFLAESSLGTWLKEQNVPAMHGVDTRALTKRIRDQGNMLGRILVESANKSNGFTSGLDAPNEILDRTSPQNQKRSINDVEFLDPNQKNLVTEGRKFLGTICNV